MRTLSSSRYEAEREQAHKFLDRVVLPDDLWTSAVKRVRSVRTPFQLARRHDTALALEAEDSAAASAWQCQLVIEPLVDARLRYAAIQLHVAHS